MKVEIWFCEAEDIRASGYGISKAKAEEKSAKHYAYDDSEACISDGWIKEAVAVDVPAGMKKYLLWTQDRG